MVNTVAIKRKAQELYTNNAHQGAYVKGYHAGLDGLTAEDCPYEDFRQTDNSNRPTFSRGLIRVWNEGLKVGYKARLRRNIERALLQADSR